MYWCSYLESTLLCTLCVVLSATCTTTSNNISQLSSELCPNPDNTTDAAEGLDNPHLDRPPDGIGTIIVSGVGPYSINVSWSEPNFEFATPICHYYLNVTYTPQQKGSHMRTTHMNVNHSINSAQIDELTADTNITIELRTCLLMPENNQTDRQFICTQAVKQVQRTASNPDRCAVGFYNSTANECEPCQCNNRTQLCESKTGRCLDCLDGSDGVRCEKCLSGYVFQNNMCVQPSPTEAETPAPIIIKATTRSNIKTSNPSTGDLATTRAADAGSSSIDLVSTSKTIPNLLDMSTQNKSIPITIIITCVLIGIAIISCISIIIYRKCGMCKNKPLPLWTIQLQGNADSQPSVAYSDVLEPQLYTSEDNRLIENDFAAHQFATNDNPYQPITA